MKNSGIIPTKTMVAATEIKPFQFLTRTSEINHIMKFGLMLINNPKKIPASPSLFFNKLNQANVINSSNGVYICPRPIVCQKPAKENSQRIFIGEGLYIYTNIEMDRI